MLIYADDILLIAPSINELLSFSRIVNLNYSGQICVSTLRNPVVSELVRDMMLNVHVL